jgi:hypothetical protein
VESDIHVPQLVLRGKQPERDSYSSSSFESIPELWGIFSRCWHLQPDARPVAIEIVQLLNKNIYPPSPAPTEASLVAIQEPQTLQSQIHHKHETIPEPAFYDKGMVRLSI